MRHFYSIDRQGRVYEFSSKKDREAFSLICSSRFIPAKSVKISYKDNRKCFSYKYGLLNTALSMAQPVKQTV